MRLKGLLRINRILELKHMEIVDDLTASYMPRTIKVSD